MAYMNVLHWWNARICPPIGFLLNTLLLWLILRRTPKEMRVHSRILLQTSLLDICLLVTMLFGTVFFIQRNEDEIVLVYSGWLLKLFESAFGSRGLVWHGLVSYCLYYFDVFSISVQFMYRYLVLNRNMHIGLLRHLLMLSVTAIAVFVLTFCLHANGNTVVPFDVSNWLAHDANDSLHLMDASVDWTDQAMGFYLTANVIFRSRRWFYWWTLLHICSYAVITFCAWRMHRFVNTHANFNANLKSLNRQLTLNLIILASIPVLLGLFLDIGLTYYYKLLVANGQSLRSISGLQFFGNLLAMWVPSLNALVSIVVNKPYRKTVFPCCCRKQHNQVVPVVKHK